MAEWPPPIDPGARWVDLRVLDPDRRRWVIGKARPVQLLEQIVMVAVDGRVFCRLCSRMVDVVELTRPGNTHGFDTSLTRIDSVHA